MAQSDDQRYRRARRRVQAEKGFYIHALVYVLVNAGLFVSNMVTLMFVPGALWFWLPLLGWGVGLAAHGLAVFAFPRWAGAGWEQRRMDELMDEDRRRDLPPDPGGRP